jgi:hypothetical protein
MSSLRFIGAVTLLAAVGCDADRVCAPGTTQTCVCAGSPGAQFCTSAGTEWGPCACLNAPAIDTAPEKAHPRSAAPSPALSDQLVLVPANPVEPPDPQSGLLSVDTTPWSRVSVDDRDLGETPVLSLRLPSGTHTLVFLAEGQRRVVRRVEVHEAQHLKVAFDLHDH